MSETGFGVGLFAAGCLYVAVLLGGITLMDFLKALLLLDKSDTAGSNGRRFLGRIAWVLIIVTLVRSGLGGPF